MATLNHPLGKEHCQCLDKVLQTIPGALELARACTDCGWDMSEYIAELQRQQTQAQKAKALFFPTEP
jgi:hypothetical protein